MRVAERSAPYNEREVLLVYVAAAAHWDESVREATEQFAGGVGRGRGQEHGHLALAEVQHHVLHVMAESSVLVRI